MAREVTASIGPESPDFMMLLISLFIAQPEAATAQKPAPAAGRSTEVRWVRFDQHFVLPRQRKTAMDGCIHSKCRHHGCFQRDCR
jgi:hypothetical protein